MDNFSDWLCRKIFHYKTSLINSKFYMVHKQLILRMCMQFQANRRTFSLGKFSYFKLTQKSALDREVVFLSIIFYTMFCRKNQQYLALNDISIVEKEDNPPNCPQIRPIEQFWAALKQRVYRGNLEAQNKAELSARILECVGQIEISLYQNLMVGLKTKVRKAADNGLTMI